MPLRACSKNLSGNFAMKHTVAEAERPYSSCRHLGFNGETISEQLRAMAFMVLNVARMGAAHRHALS